MKTPPPEVLEAARVVERWADNNLCSDFRIGKIKYIAPVGCGGDPLADDLTDDWCTDYHCAGDCGLRGHGVQHARGK